MLKIVLETVFSILVNIFVTTKMNYDSDDIFLEEEHLLLSYKNAGDKELKEQYRYAVINQGSELNRVQGFITEI